MRAAIFAVVRVCQDRPSHRRDRRMGICVAERSAVTDRVLGFLGVAALAGAAAIIGLFGVSDLFGSTDFGVRLRAGLMALAALYLVLGAVVLALHLVPRA